MIRFSTARKAYTELYSRGIYLSELVRYLETSARAFEHKHCNFSFFFHHLLNPVYNWFAHLGERERERHAELSLFWIEEAETEALSCAQEYIFFLLLGRRVDVYIW